MKFPLYIAKRYLFSRSSNNAINIITIIAALGVVVGAMALFIVLSGFAGLKDFSLQFTNVFDSDLKVLPASGKTLSFAVNTEESLNDIEGIASYTRVIEERVFLNFKGKNHIAYIKGVDENYGTVNPIDSILFHQEWFVPNREEVVIGLNTAHKLSLGVRDYSSLLEIYVPKPGTGQINALDPTNAFTKQNAIVSGIYAVNEDLNGKYVFSDLEFARTLLQLDSTTVSSVELKLTPTASEEKVRGDVEALFNGVGRQDIQIKNRIQQNDALYKMLNSENLVVYFVGTLVLIIAVFNIVGSLIMMILDKRKDIKTLHSMGAELKSVRKIFFWQGTIMTTLAGLFGILLGVIAVWGQLQFKYVNITSTLPYPVQLTLLNVLIVFVTITLLGIIASKIASSRVRSALLN
ncbi:ABC transporter permease [Cochleicola gelatinilyticus]|uniref:ABC transporter permease n=1 Tax=Cochleicola gelatinilyticus TaxID=1763537 RepID=A0A167J2C7_9FLAO|nr:FtsX-like permease family protein [Cochleicola gelatinilyticus]OAB80270.1 hypothetical protein ULVI_05910 [Cochleicola gelatinilyticus]